MRRLLLVLALLAGALAACGPRDPTDASILTIVVSSYPLEYAVERVVGEHVNLTNLTPAGVEPHDLELTSDDIDHIDDADLVFYIGSGFQPSIAAAANRRRKVATDVGAGLISRKGDPHFWLDPTLMAKAVDRIARAAAKADPKNAKFMRDNARRYKLQLAGLDSEFSNSLSHCQRNEIVTAHAAFGYLAARYRLRQEAVTGISPDVEPSPKRLAQLSALIRRDGVTTVFFEKLVPRDFADTLARDAGVRTALLDPLEALTKKEYDAFDDYLTVMRRNLTALKDALGCS